MEEKNNEFKNIYIKQNFVLEIKKKKKDFSEGKEKLFMGIACFLNVC